jgi:hypothetical protein
MDIHIAQAEHHQPVILNKLQHFFISCGRRHGQRLEQPKDFLSVLQIPAGQLADDEWMGDHVSFLQEFDEAGAARSEMSNPNGCIDENHCGYR